MSSVTPVTCSRCGASFTPSAALLERFPGWTPRECARCFRATERKPDEARKPQRARASRPVVSREEHLTIEQVLERYSEGPDTGVFTDGSAIPNPGPGGWGAVYVRDGEVLDQAYGHEPRTTNNRMELRALLAALELVPAGTSARVHTDSNLAVQTVNQWAAGWEKRGWKRRTGPVENLDLVRPLYEGFRARPELELVWIKAHVGYRWNEYADSLATAWARDTL